MKLLLILVLLVFTNIAFSQNFDLKPLRNDVIKAALNKKKYSEDAVYIYLIQNYKTLTNKESITNESGVICAFTQQFENNIVYKERGCEEDKGSVVLITFPKANRKELQKWIENIAVFHSEIKNTWDKKGLIYSPEDDGAGCYYYIKETPTQSIVTIDCSC